jgi:hypothetical protein
MARSDMIKYVLIASLVAVLFCGYGYSQNLDIWNISGTLYRGAPEIISVYNNDYLFSIKLGVFETYTVTDTSGPVLLNSYPLWDYANCFELINQFGFMGTATGLLIWDLSNPVEPQDFYYNGSITGINSIALADSFAYALNNTSLFIIDITDPHDIEIIDSIRIA